MAFKDLTDFLDPDLHLPWGGKTYRIPAATLELGLEMQHIFNIGLAVASDRDPNTQDVELLNDEQEKDFVERALSGAADELKADGVPFQVMKLMAMTLLFDTVADRETAEAYWGSAGKAQGGNRAARRTATRTRTDAATTTRKQGSRTGTTNRKAATSGGTSSSTGV